MMKKILIIIILFVLNNLCFGQNGVRKIYYAKGKLESAVSFSDEVLDGNSKWYYLNGNLKFEKNYLSGVLHGWIREYYKNGLLNEEYFVSNGILDGISKKYYNNGALKYVKVFDTGKLKSSKSFEYDSLFIPTIDLFVGRSKKNRTINENQFICELDVCPEPIGGTEAIEKNIIYPKEISKIKKGFILVTALINKMGNAERVEVIKSLDKIYDKAIINAVKRTRFIPGKNKNRIVNAEVTFRVNINMESK